MALETLDQCPLCGSQATENHLEIKDHSNTLESFKTERCTSCSLVFTNPRPDEDSIGPYYESEHYISHNNSREGLVANLYHQVRKITLNSKLKLVQRLMGKSPLLDYGTGTGAFLKHCQENGIISFGYEPSDSARKVGKTDHQVEYIDVFKSNKTYSVITLWHVLEHVHKIDATIQRLLTQLDEKGHLILALPNHESHDALYYKTHWAAWDIPIHLYHFNKKAIQQLSNQYNLDLVEVLPMKFDSYYVSLLSSKYRSGRTKYLEAFKVGLQSNLKAGSDNYSSLIYVLQKR